VNIVDNYLTDREFSELKKVIWDPSFPWHFNQIITMEEPEETGEYYMTHVFYNQRQNFQSQYFPLVYDLLNKIQPKALIRVKANLYLNMGKGVVEHAPHTDYSFSHNGGVFSMNTCDGYTKQGDEKADSVENRLVTFDAGVKHQSTSVSNTKVRMNININYF
jgi:hypothetical protein|tara:strand:+ start:793 stop:1278 length:486 start_codon:yes stop_codon:yes gene_type:complete